MDNEEQCPDCEGTGEELEWCCKSEAIARLSHCACYGKPQYKQECEKCDGNGRI